MIIDNNKEVLYICEKCGNKVYEKYGSGRFCSKSCANSRIFSEESKTKISKALKGKPFTGGSGFKKGHKGIGDRKEAARKMRETFRKKRENRTYEQLTLREKVLFNQNNCCNKCGLDTWNNLPLKLELHHKDGNHKNNNITNLEFLCPNCHSQTPSWRKKNYNSSAKFKS